MAENTKKPGSMVIHLDEADMIRYLSDRDRGRLLLALVDYAQSGVQPAGFKGSLAMCYEQMRRSIDRNVERYQKRCSRNSENASKRWNDASPDAPACSGVQTDAPACPGMQTDAIACDGMSSHANDANSNSNPNPNSNVTQTQTETQTVTPTVTQAQTVTQAAAQSPSPAAAPLGQEAAFGDDGARPDADEEDEEDEDEEDEDEEDEDEEDEEDYPDIDDVLAGIYDRYYEVLDFCDERIAQFYAQVRDPEHLTQAEAARLDSLQTMRDDIEEYMESEVHNAIEMDFCMHGPTAEELRSDPRVQELERLFAEQKKSEQA